MRKTITWGLVLLLLAAGYSAWPFFVLFRLLDAVERRDEAQVSKMLDLPRLRSDLVGQVVATYARVAGTSTSPAAQQFAAALAGSVADPLAAKLVTTEAVAELVRTGWPSPRSVRSRRSSIACASTTGRGGSTSIPNTASTSSGSGCPSASPRLSSTGCCCNGAGLTGSSPACGCRPRSRSGWCAS